MFPITAKTVLVILAHPDDEFTFAGTLWKLFKSGAKIIVVYLTSGRQGRLPTSQKMLEQLLAVVELGPLVANNLDLFETADQAKFVEEMIAKWWPDLVIAISPHSADHHEHVTTARMVVKAAEQAGILNILLAEPPKGHLEFHPTFFVEMDTDALLFKFRLLGAHNSFKQAWYLEKETLMTHMRYWAILKALPDKLFEAFIAHRLTI